MNSSASSDDLWLIRTAKNVIAGPVSKEKLIRMIGSGELSLQDEICRGNHYWIYLHEDQEMKAQLGVLAPRLSLEDAEVTESTLTRPEVVPELTEPVPAGDFDPEQTAILSNRALREFQPNRPQNPQVVQMRERGASEAPSSPLRRIAAPGTAAVEVVGVAGKSQSFLKIVLVLLLLGALTAFGILMMKLGHI